MQAAAGPSVGSPAEGSVPVDDEAGKQEAGSPGSVDTFSLLPPLIVDPSSKPEPGSSPKPEPGSSNGPQTSLASPKPDPTPDPGPDAAPPQPLVYLPLDCLNPYLARVWGSPDGVLPEEDIEVMCEALQAPRLVRHLRELRARHLRKRGAGAGQGGGGRLLLQPAPGAARRRWSSPCPLLLPPLQPQQRLHPLLLLLGRERREVLRRRRGRGPLPPLLLLPVPLLV